MPYGPVNSCDTQTLNNPSVESQFPTGTTPGVRTGELSALCSYGYSPLVMTGLLRQICIQHFSDSRNILNASLRKRMQAEGGWTPNARTGIYIESLHNWRPELTESRPGIVLKEQDWQWQRRGIGDKFREDWRSGQVTYHGFWQGAHTLFALGNEGAETQILAIEIAKILLWYSPRFTRDLGMHRFVLVSIGAVSALKESTENYVVPVNVAYYVQESWTLTPEAPRLKRIDARFADEVKQY